MKENPFNFDYIIFRYLYAISENISEDTYNEVSDYKIKKFIKYMNELVISLNNNQKMLFMDDMFSFSRFELESLKINDKNDSLHLLGKLKEYNSNYYYPETEVVFKRIQVEFIKNGFKEKVTLDSVLSLPLYLQSVQPYYDDNDKKHIVDIYLSLDIYNPEYNDIIKGNSLANICHMRVSYEDCVAELGIRKIDYDPYDTNVGDVVED